MKFTLMSDVHIDSMPWNWDTILADVEPTDTLVVAGDISNDVWHTCRWLVQAKTWFPNVLWVAGNHDFYNTGRHKTMLIPNREWAEQWPYPRSVREIIDHYVKWSNHHGIHFLNRNAVAIDGVTFVGATGWHDYVAGEPFSREDQIKAWYTSLNDKIIVWESDDLKPNHRHAFDAAKRDAEYLKASTAAIMGPIVMVTHHVPHRNLKWEMPHDLVWTKLHGCFVNTKLENISSANIKYWCYGHTHQRKLQTINHCDYVCNARGYMHERINWQPLVLEA